MSITPIIRTVRWNLVKWLCYVALPLCPQLLLAEVITFADEQVKSLCVANWDVDQDGELSDGEAASVTTLGGTFAFNSEISSFDELRFFTGLTSINKFELMNCTNLQHVTIPSGVTEIQERAFYGCSSLNSIIIPGNVNTIGEQAFGACTHLKNAVLENGLQKLGEKVFYYCRALESVSIPASLTEIAMDAFGNCSALAKISVDPANEVFDSRNDCNAIVQTKKNTIFLGCQSTVIPESVTAIGNGAFNGCIGLSTIDIPSSVTKIYSMAFNGCKGLIEITIPSSVTELGTGAFWGCTSLQSISFSEGLTKIGEHAFDGCKSLTKVTLPSTIIRLGTGAFFGCTQMKEVNVLFPTPLVIEASTFPERRSSTLNVPLGSKQAFKNANVWKEFRQILEIYPLGDVNHDGAINVLDVTMGIDYILGKKPEGFYVEEANVNGDEFINVLDVTRIIDIILQK